MRVSIAVLGVIKYNSITGQALLYGVPDTDLLCGPPKHSREMTVVFRGPSSLAYPPIHGERIRFEYETTLNGVIFACRVISREAPGDLSCTGPEGITAGTGHNPPSEYIVGYIREIMGLQFELSGKTEFSSCGHQVRNCISSFVENHGRDSVFFLEAVALDFFSLIEDPETKAISECGLSVKRNKIYAVNPLISDRPFLNSISGKEVSLAAVYSGIYKDIYSKKRGSFAGEIKECASQLPEFTQRSAVRLLMNAVILLGMRFSEHFFLSLDICRENSSRLVRSMGPRAVETFIKDPYAVSELGFTSPLSVAKFLESEDIRFGKMSDFIKASAGAVLGREYSNGTEAIPEDEFREMLMHEINSSGIFKADIPLVSEIVSKEGGEIFGSFAVRNVHGKKFFLPASLVFKEDYLASKLVRINGSGINIPKEKLIFSGIKKIFTEEQKKNENYLFFGKYLLDGFASIFGEHGVGDYAVSQTEAVGKLLSSSGIDILTGEPGSGKTTIIKVISILASFAGVRVNILSPTGKAVKRTEELLFTSSLPEETQERIKLMTVHKYVYSMSGKKSYEGMQVFIVDECSMLDTEIFTRLISLIPTGSRLILSGDTDQLTSTGGGSPFREIIDSCMFRHIVLTGSYRHTNPAIQTLAEKIRVPGRLYKVSEMCRSCGGDIYDLRDEISL